MEGDQKEAENENTQNTTFNRSNNTIFEGGGRQQVEEFDGELTEISEEDSKAQESTIQNEPIKHDFPQIEFEKQHRLDKQQSNMKMLENLHTNLHKKSDQRRVFYIQNTINSIPTAETIRYEKENTKRFMEEMTQAQEYRNDLMYYEAEQIK